MYVCMYVCMSVCLCMYAGFLKSSSFGVNTLFCDQTVLRTIFCDQTVWRVLFCDQTGWRTLFCDQTARRTLFCDQTVLITQFCDQTGLLFFWRQDSDNMASLAPFFGHFRPKNGIAEHMPTRKRGGKAGKWQPKMGSHMWTWIGLTGALISGSYVFCNSPANWLISQLPANISRLTLSLLITQPTGHCQQSTRTVPVPHPYRTHVPRVPYPCTQCTVPMYPMYRTHVPSVPYPCTQCTVPMYPMYRTQKR